MESKIHFTFDASKTLHEYDDFFHAVGYDEILATSSPLGRASIKLLDELDTGIKYIRIHNMFTGSQGDLRGHVDAGCNPIVKYSDGRLDFDWTKMDSVFDVLIENNFIPYIEFGFMPPELSSACSGDKKLWRYPPKDYQAWRELIRETVAHFKGRYPDRIQEFLWEVWNEPNRLWLIPGYFKGKSSDYFKLYDYTAAGLLDIFPDGDFKLGGPALSGKWLPFLNKFLKHCLYGRNYVTGEIGSKMDFVSFHLKGGAYFQTPNIKKIIKNLRTHMKLISTYKKDGWRARLRGNRNYLPDDVEIHITEMDPVVGCARGIESNKNLNFRNTEYYSAYTGFMATWFQYVRIQKNYNLKWVFSDNIHFADEAALLEIFNGCRSPTTAPFQADNLDDALNETRVIAKPVVKGFQVLHQLQGEMFARETPESNVFDNLTAMATRTNEKIKILVSHFNPEFDYDETRVASINLIALKKNGIAKITEFKIDKNNNNTYRLWLEMGKPLDLSDDQYQKMKQVELLKPTKTWNQPFNGQKLRFNCACEPQSLNYYEIEFEEKKSKKD